MEFPRKQPLGRFRIRWLLWKYVDYCVWSRYGILGSAAELISTLSTKHDWLFHGLCSHVLMFEWAVLPQPAGISREATHFSKTSVSFYLATWCWIPEDNILHFHLCENLWCGMFLYCHVFLCIQGRIHFITITWNMYRCAVNLSQSDVPESIGTLRGYHNLYLACVLHVNDGWTRAWREPLGVCWYKCIVQGAVVLYCRIHWGSLVI
jgi:hypothetical protein